MSLKGKTFVVTGAAGPMGMAVVRAALEDGAQVALVDVDALRLDSVVRFLRGSTLAVPCDVSDSGAVRAAHLQVEKALGPVDVLVNNAGVLSNNKAEETDDAEWRRLMAVNVDGAFYWARTVLPGMKQRGWGRIVNIASLAAKTGGLTAGTAYAASKRALVFPGAFAHAGGMDGVAGIGGGAGRLARSRDVQRRGAGDHHAGAERDKDRSFHVSVSGGWGRSHDRGRLSTGL